MRQKFGYNVLGLFFVLLFGVCHDLPTALAQQPASLVIEGGTLIDGNGGTPIRDAVVIIQGNKISSVSRRGQETYPANARVIKADGKFVLPGLFDSEADNDWFFGEAFINHGITSNIDVGFSGEMVVPYRDAVLHGKFLGPRVFTAISRLSSEYNAGQTGLEGPMTSSRVPTTPEEARNLVKLWIAAGADFVILEDGGLSMDIIHAVFDEAAKAGKPVFTRAYGPVLFPKDAALLGSASLPHSAGIGLSITKDPSKWQARADDRNEIDRYAEMDEAKAKDLIAVLVAHKVALVPTFSINFPGYPKDWTRFEAEAHQMFSDENLLAYYPEDAIQAVFARFTRIDMGEVRERRIKGYQNALRFHKMFADAGGHIIVSGHTNTSKPPGLDLQQEMQIMAEGGLTPMQIIQGSTKWPAELIRKQDQLGTVEAGKLADVIILGQDPLKDIRNIASVETVVFDGKVVDPVYHSTYHVPFEIGGPHFTPTVSALPWYMALKKVNRPGGGQGASGAQTANAGAVPDPANSPQPAIESVNPFIVTQESGNVTVNLKGVNFVRRSSAYFKGRLMSSRSVSSTELQVTLDAEALRTAGRFALVVKNPEPMDPFFTEGMWGNGTSNVAYVIVNFKY